MTSSEISTNVRPSSSGRGPTTNDAFAVRAVRGAMRALTVVSPSLSSKWALRLFISPRRHRRPEREVRLLTTATPCDFPWREVTLRGWSWGEGPAVMLLHGWEGRGAQLGAFVEPLVQAGFRVITFDGPAHGDSPGERITPYDLADAARTFAAHVGGIYAVVAHSMGGLSASLALREGLQIERAVFVAPGTHPTRATGQVAELLDLPPSVLAGMREGLAARLGTSWHQVAISDPFADHRAPLFVAHDVGDHDVPIAEAEAMCAAWGQAELYRTAGLGHRRILRDPEVVRRSVAFLLDGRGAPASAA